MKKIIYLLLFIPTLLLGETYTTIKDGDWNDKSTWDKHFYSFNNGDTLYVNHKINVNNGEINGPIVYVNENGELTGQSLNVNGGQLINNGNINLNNLTNNGCKIINLTLITLTNNLTNNGDSIINNGNIHSKNVINNSGNISNNGNLFISDKLTNNSTINNDGYLEVDEIINNSGYIIGNGFIRVNKITNWANIGGSLDLCDILHKLPPIPKGNPLEVSVTRCGKFPLPITLDKCNPYIDGDNLIFGFSVRSQINNDYYSIYALNENGERIEVSKIDGDGTSYEHKLYNPIIHKNKIKGYNYIYLEQTDYNGNINKLNCNIVTTFEYGEDMKVKINKNIIQIYPNPATHDANIKINNINENTSLYLTVYDINGKEIINKKIIGGEEYQTSINTKGIYFLNVRDIFGITTEKIIIN